jgi:hypothetical protein
LTQIPSFKAEDQPTLSKVKSVDKLRPEDFGKKKPELNINLNNLHTDGTEKIYDGMHSPRAVFNE